jgi:hypothetical protein
MHRIRPKKKASCFTTSVPGALGTFPMALNDSMAVIGYYLVSPTIAYGFVENAGNNRGSYISRSALSY